MPDQTLAPGQAAGGGNVGPQRAPGGRPAPCEMPDAMVALSALVASPTVLWRDAPRRSLPRPSWSNGGLNGLYARSWNLGQPFERRPIVQQKPACVKNTERPRRRRGPEGVGAARAPPKFPPSRGAWRPQKAHAWHGTRGRPKPPGPRSACNAAQPQPPSARPRGLPPAPAVWNPRCRATAVQPPTGRAQSDELKNKRSDLNAPRPWWVCGAAVSCVCGSTPRPPQWLAPIL